MEESKRWSKRLFDSVGLPLSCCVLALLLCSKLAVSRRIYCPLQSLTPCKICREVPYCYQSVCAHLLIFSYEWNVIVQLEYIVCLLIYGPCLLVERYCLTFLKVCCDSQAWSFHVNADLLMLRKSVYLIVIYQVWRFLEVERYAGTLIK